MTIMGRVAISAVIAPAVMMQVRYSPYSTDPIVNTMRVYTRCFDNDDCDIPTTCSCAMVGMRVCCNVHGIDDLAEGTCDEDPPFLHFPPRW